MFRYFVLDSSVIIGVLEEPWYDLHLLCVDRDLYSSTYFHSESSKCKK